MLAETSAAVAFGAMLANGSFLASAGVRATWASAAVERAASMVAATVTRRIDRLP